MNVDKLRMALIAPGFSRDQDDWAIPALQHYASRLANQLDLTLFSLRYPAAGIYDWGQFEHHAIGGGRRFGWSSAAIISQTVRRIIQCHRQRPFDLLHAFWADEPGLAAVLAGQLSRLPVVVSLGGGELVHLKDIDYGTAGSPIRRQVVHLSLRGARAVTAGSAYQLRMAHRLGLPQAKLQELPLGVDINIFAVAPVPPLETPAIIQAASLSPVKDQALCLETLAILIQRWPAARLHLAGQGPQKVMLLEKASQLGIDQAIRWLGAVPHSAMPAVYQQGHIYLQTSRHESQGMAVLEAMATGLPAVGTPVGLLPQVSPTAASETASGLAENIMALMSDKTEYVKARKSARRIVEEDYTLDGAVSSFINLYLQLAGRAERPSRNV